jgi:hypothetical protein
MTYFSGKAKNDAGIFVAGIGEIKTKLPTIAATTAVTTASAAAAAASASATASAETASVIILRLCLVNL